MSGFPILGNLANGAASGDLTGSYPNPTVAKIQGTAISSAIAGELAAGTLPSYLQLVGGTMTGPLIANGTVMLDGPGNIRNPVNIQPVINGSLLGAGNIQSKMLLGIQGILKGGFTNENAGNSLSPTVAWGDSVYLGTGTTAGDVAGLASLIGIEGGPFLSTPSASLGLMVGIQADVEILSTATNAIVTQTVGLLIPAIAALPGGATIGAAYGIEVIGPTVGGSNFGILTDGGAPNRLQGRLDITNTLNALSGMLQLQADFSNTALITLYNNATANGLIQFTLGTNTGAWYFKNASSVNVVIISSSGQLTIGAPPAFTTGDKYLVYNPTSKMIEVSALGPLS